MKPVYSFAPTPLATSPGCCQTNTSVLTPFRFRSATPHLEFTFLHLQWVILWVSAYKNPFLGKMQISVRIKCVGLPLRLMLAFYRTLFLMLSERTCLTHHRILNVESHISMLSHQWGSFPRGIQRRKPSTPFSVEPEEMGRWSLRVPGQPGLFRKTLSRKTNKQTQLKETY